MRTIHYLIIWAVMIDATILQIILVTSAATVLFKMFSIIVLALLQATLSAAYFLNLRYETRVLSLLPITALIVLSTLLLTSILSMFGM